MDGTTAYSLCRSVNASNSNNFCLVNTDGNANNANAYNSYGVAPGFHKPVMGWVKRGCHTGGPEPYVKGEILPRREPKTAH